MLLLLAAIVSSLVLVIEIMRNAPLCRSATHLCTHSDKEGGTGTQSNMSDED